jgi:hypothetical protein
MEHVEQPQGFAAFTYNVIDGRPSCVRRGAPAAAAAAADAEVAATGAAPPRKGLSLSDGNKRVCPTPEVTGARRKRPAPARDCAPSRQRAVTAARPQPTPETFARRGASAPALGARSRAAADEPIDLTNTSSGSESGGEEASEPTLRAGDRTADCTTSPTAAPPRQPQREQLKRAQVELRDALDAQQRKQKLNDELRLEITELLKVIETLRTEKSQASHLQTASLDRISDLEARLAAAAAASGGTFGDSSRGCAQLQMYVRHLSERLAEVIRIDVPSDVSLSTSEGTVACAEQLAVGLANLISEQRNVAESASREAAEERKAREQVDAALVRAGQAAEATASVKLGAQLSHLEAEKGRQAWEMQQAMAAMKGTTIRILAAAFATHAVAWTLVHDMCARMYMVADEYERKLAEQRGAIMCLERNLANYIQLQQQQQHQQQQHQQFVAPPLTASKPNIPVRRYSAPNRV